MAKIKTTETINVNTSNFDSVKETYDREQKVLFMCSVCGQMSSRPLRHLTKELICTKCSKNITMLERYGVRSKAVLQETKDKMKQTCLKRYGVEHFSKTDEFKKEVKDTWDKINKSDYWENRKKQHKEKYGVEYSFQRDDVKEKIFRTNIEKYGCKCSLQAEEIKEKSKNTIMKKYGVDNVSKSDEIKKKKVETCLQHYGVEYWSQTEDFKKHMGEVYDYNTYEKVKSTMIKKYGYENPFMVPEFQEKIRLTMIEKYGFPRYRQNPELNREVTNQILEKYGKLSFNKKYKYDEIVFDSTWEVYYYIYLKHKNVCFEFHPNTKIRYDFNDEEHFYFPDFKVEDTFVEIKGDHFFMEDGRMCNPYDHSKDALFEAKHQCMLKNNVVILTSIDIFPIIDWVNNNLGEPSMVATN